MSLQDHIDFSKKLDDLLIQRGLMVETDDHLYKAAVSIEKAKYYKRLSKLDRQ